MKEIVSAGMGLLVIGDMFFLLWSLLTRPTPDIANAQAISSILGGWGGVILGYYFGRIPAERAAGRAEAAASAFETAKNAAIESRRDVLEGQEKLTIDMEETLKMYRKTIASLMERIDESDVES